MTLRTARTTNRTTRPDSGAADSADDNSVALNGSNDWAAIAPSTGAAILGAWDGKRLSKKIAGDMLRKVFAYVLLSVGVEVSDTSSQRTASGCHPR